MTYADPDIYCNNCGGPKGLDVMCEPCGDYVDHVTRERERARLRVDRDFARMEDYRYPVFSDEFDEEGLAW